MSSPLLAQLEALLFAYGEPIEIPKIAKIFGIPAEEVHGLIQNLEAACADDGRGLGVLIHGGAVQLGTKASLKGFMETVMKSELEEELTPAALETLAIVSYVGPLSRSALDYIRGVNSSFTLRTLLLRGLIERFLEPEKGRGYQYAVSFEFLKHAGLTKVSELPDYERLRDVVKKFEIAV